MSTHPHDVIYEGKCFLGVVSHWKKNIFLFQIDLDLGKKLGLSSKLTAESDAKFVDLYAYWEKVKQHSPISIFSLGLLPSSLRKSSAKIVYNPTESETKEFSINFSLGRIYILLIEDNVTFSFGQNKQRVEI